MAELRVAIIFDDTARPETTGGYCRRALGEFASVEHFLPSQSEQIPRRGFDLYLMIDDGLRFHLPSNLHPAAWWAIDTHLDFEWYRGEGMRFDHVFVAQQADVSRLLGHGVRASWLPLACDPAIHRKHQVEKRHDLCFLGNLSPGEREKLVWLLQEQFHSTFVGRRYFDEMALIYSASRIVFNRSIRDDLNMRVFEALACGSLLLTNALPAESGQDELFQDGTHFTTYSCPEELLDKARFYLNHEEIRERIAATGQQRVLAAHTYVHRMRSIIETVASGAVKSAPIGLSNAPSLPNSRGDRETNDVSAPPEGRMRVLYVGVFSNPWSIENAVAEAMRQRGHTVETVDENAAENPQWVVQRLRKGTFDCLLFCKGRIGRKSLHDMLFTSGEDIAEVIQDSPVPCYTWYFDRAHAYESSREQWMQRVAPLCRVAFVTDGQLTRTVAASWYWLQFGFRPSDLGSEPPAGPRRHPVGFIGSVYGGRVDELSAVSEAVKVRMISDAAGPARHGALHKCDIILGPRYPSTPGYWSDRLYLVLGHGAFFLAPEVDGMREEGFEPGVHYAALGNDPVADIRYWLDRPEERKKIAAAGQELVLRRYTYNHRVEELCRVMARTLRDPKDLPVKRFGTVSTTAPALPCASQVAGSKSETQRVTIDRKPPTNRHHQKEVFYFDWPRLDLLELIPSESRRVLDIGCGAGRVGEALKRRSGSHVTGIEIDADAAKLASVRLDEVHVGDIEKLDLPFGLGAFDTIICGDVLTPHPPSAAGARLESNFLSVTDP